LFAVPGHGDERGGAAGVDDPDAHAFGEPPQELGPGLLLGGDGRGRPGPEDKHHLGSLRGHGGHVGGHVGVALAHGEGARREGGAHHGRRGGDHQRDLALGPAVTAEDPDVISVLFLGAEGGGADEQDGENGDDGGGAGGNRRCPPGEAAHGAHATPLGEACRALREAGVGPWRSPYRTRVWWPSQYRSLSSRL
jgi:hypothetical protein